MKKIISKNVKETKNIGLKLAKNLKSGDTLALIGNLGSGKTTFLQGLAKGLKVRQRVLSPSFVQLKIYPLSGKYGKYLYHFDFYRLVSFSQLEIKGLKEYLRIKNGIIVIEWADKILKLLPQKTKVIYFSLINENTRLLTFSRIKNKKP